MTPAPRDQLREGGRGGGRGKTVGWRPPGASAPSDAPSAPWQVAERAERVLPRAAPHRAPRPACHLLPPVDEGVRPRRARNFAGNVEPVGGGRDGEAPLQTPRNPAPSPRRAPSREPLHRGARGPRVAGVRAVGPAREKGGQPGSGDAPQPRLHLRGADPAGVRALQPQPPPPPSRAPATPPAPTRGAKGMPVGVDRTGPEVTPNSLPSLPFLRKQRARRCNSVSVSGCLEGP